MKTVQVIIIYYDFGKPLTTLRATRMLIYLAYRLNDDRKDNYAEGCYGTTLTNTKVKQRQA